jgi:hypothetical protein
MIQAPEHYFHEKKSFIIMVTGWIPMPHSHLLVLGSRPYLNGRHQFNKREADPGTNLIKNYNCNLRL